MKVGLVLEGGAMRGMMYTGGVLDIFLDNNIEVDCIVGVSAGVLSGVNYLSKQRGRVIRYNKKFCKDRRYMGWSSYISSGNIVNKDFAFYDVPFKYDIFDEETYKKSEIDFYATITNIESGKAEYVKITDVKEQMEVLRATSAMPYVSEIVELESGKYLDGGLADSIPINKCKELGYDKIIVVLTRPLGYKKEKSNMFLANVMYKKYPNLIKTIENRAENYNRTVKKIIGMEKKQEIFVIRPSKTIKISRLEKDENKLQEVYDLGIQDCKKAIKRLKKYINMEEKK